MGRTIEIPKQDWFLYFERFSKRAMGQPIHVEVENREIGDQEMTRTLPLVGIELETKGSEAGDIEVTVEDDQEELTHHIDQPTRVFLLVDDNDNINSMDIEDQDGGKTLVFFDGSVRVPAQVSLGIEEPAPGP
ncbi:DUF5335 family protein [Vitiosangium sp. GDMCC 1.1324]|uniref:DUF5335 family protein n=1 Tax=Vitiosangium sp. (strain GDMCC 1.1324) TaxID=2138576 RepID=UPI000D3ADB3B|nr:DUF5335 family protein [Vitiosangium sp. GDMCC 1.1324]PTL82060.1 hypothetical protein DAT35_19840 [Vitiosangium sp. GDMCC 1.1324]